MSDIDTVAWGETVEHLAERATACIESGDPLFVVDARLVLSLVATAKEAEHRLQSALDELGRKDAYAIEQYERAERAERERDELQDRALDDLASATRQEG